MRHLSGNELVDAVEGTLAADRSAHAAECGACREQVDALRATLNDAASIDVPEPSPLFWDHFSARVRKAVDEAPAPTVAWWRRPAVSLALAAAGAVLVVAAVWMNQPASLVRPAPVVATAPPDVSGSSDAGAANANDAVWALLRAAASDLELKDAHDAGLSVRPASVDKAVLDLTPVERTELERLIREEMKHSGA
jgi:hypothetical protein